MCVMAEKRSSHLRVVRTPSAPARSREASRADTPPTVSYWADPMAIATWRTQVEHAEIRQRGRWTWYDHFEVRVAKVERAYNWTR